MIETNPIILCCSGNSIPFLNSQYNSNGFKRGLDYRLENILRKNFSLGINYFFKYGMKTTLNTSVDWQFYNDNKEALKNLDLVVCAKHDQLKNPNDNTFLLPFTHKYFGKDSWEKGFYSTHLSSLFSLTLSIALGFKEIYILGMDCCEINGRTHFYQGVVNLKEMSKCSPALKKFRGIGKQGKGYKSSPYNNVKSLNEKWFAPYKDEDVKIYNVSPESVITLFPKLTYEEFYSRVGNNKIYQPDAQEKIIQKIRCNLK